MIKFIVVIAFSLIIISLGSALFHLVKHKGEKPSQDTVKALTFRISLSVVLFIFIFLAIASGIYQPTGLGTQMHLKQQLQNNAVTKKNL
jgi:uncharacterized membrane protein YidH (DUF202 family)